MPPVRTDQQLKIVAALALAGLVCGGLLIVTEFLHVGEPTKLWLGLQVNGWGGAERVFIFLFGVVHVLVGAIITVCRRTAT